MSVSIRLSVTLVHWRMIANLGFSGREGRDHRWEEWRDHLVLC